MRFILQGSGTPQGLLTGRHKLKAFVFAAGLALILGACAQKARQAPPPVYEPPPSDIVSTPEAPGETAFDPIPEALPAVTGVELEGSVTVGILLPLTGRHAAIGQALLNAAQLALFDLADDDFKMIVGDTGGTPEGARAATRDLLDQGAGLILGPLFSTAVGPVAEEAALRGVSVRNMRVSLHGTAPKLRCRICGIVRRRCA